MPGDTDNLRDGRLLHADNFLFPSNPSSGQASRLTKTKKITRQKKEGDSHYAWACGSATYGRF